jgi:hypothetical protein
VVATAYEVGINPVPLNTGPEILHEDRSEEI